MTRRGWGEDSGKTVAGCGDLGIEEHLDGAAAFGGTFTVRTRENTGVARAPPRGTGPAGTWLSSTYSQLMLVTHFGQIQPEAGRQEVFCRNPCPIGLTCFPSMGYVLLLFFQPLHKPLLSCIPHQKVSSIKGRSYGSHSLP